MTNDDLGDPKENEKILEALEELVETTPWDKSNFLKAMGSKFKQLRARLKLTVQLQRAASQKADEADTSSLKVPEKSAEVQEVYVSLYSSDGANLSNWERMLSNIAYLIVSRHVYVKEEGVRSWIRSRLNQKNEAYVTVLVHKSDIGTPVHPGAAKDKLGHELVVAKGTLRHAPVITRFTHISGVYEWRDDKFKLVRVGEVESD